MNPLTVVIVAAAFACGWLIRAVWWSDPADVLMLRKALAESVAQVDERHGAYLDLLAEQVEAEKRAQQWEAVARNCATPLGILALDERLDAETRAAIARTWDTQTTNHGVAA